MITDPKDPLKVPMMPFAPKPKNLYLVFGWKVGISERNLVMFEKGEEARDLKISLTISADGQNFFVGRLLAVVETTEGEQFTWCSTPVAQDHEDLSKSAEKLGMPQEKTPMLYAIAG